MSGLQGDAKEPLLQLPFSPHPVGVRCRPSDQQPASSSFAPPPPRIRPPSHRSPPRHRHAQHSTPQNLRQPAARSFRSRLPSFRCKLQCNRTVRSRGRPARLFSPLTPPTHPSIHKPLYGPQHASLALCVAAFVAASSAERVAVKVLVDRLLSYRYVLTMAVILAHALVACTRAAWRSFQPVGPAREGRRQAARRRPPPFPPHRRA